MSSNREFTRFKKRYLRRERRKIRKEKACPTCRYRVWTERPSPHVCGGCVGGGVFGNWKKRRLWQRVRDFIKYRI